MPPAADPTSTLANGLGSNFLPWALAICLVAIAYLFKTLNEERKATALAVAAAAEKANAAAEKASAERLADVKQDAAEQRVILSQIVPLATKLTMGLEILERVTSSLTRE